MLWFACMLISSCWLMVFLVPFHNFLHTYREEEIEDTLLNSKEEGINVIKS